MTAPRDTLICEQLAALTSTIASSPLPSEIISETRLCFLDFLASTGAAPLTPMITETAAIFGAGSAVLLHGGAGMSVAGATFAHSFLSTVEDIDDAHELASGMHLSATVFPAIFSFAQAQGCTKARFLRAVLAGYEVAGRLSRSMDNGLRARGFHATGAIGPFAACAAVCVLKGLTQKQMEHAFGIAASGAGGLFAFLKKGADSRHLHAATASLAGLAAAMAAGHGATGPLTAFEGPDGFIGPYAETCDTSIIFSRSPGSDQPFEILNAYHKKFSACGHAIPGLTLALELRNVHHPSTSKIASIQIFGYPASAKLTNFPVKTVSEAKFSLPIAFTLAYLYGDVSPVEMTMEVITRQEVQNMAQKISVHERSEHTRRFPACRSGSIRVTYTDNTVLTLSTETPIGMKGNRLSLEEVLSKFGRFATPVLGQARADTVIGAVQQLDDSKTIFWDLKNPTSA